MKKIISAILLVLHVNLIGCVSVQAVDREYLKYHQSKPLRIEMKDGSTIKLPSGDYYITSYADSLMINGTGIRTAVDRASKHFTGSIRSSEIITVEVVESSPLCMYISALQR